MTTTANIATAILSENGYVLADFPNLTLTILENKIDQAINYVNLMARTSIAALSGAAESKSFVFTAGEDIPVVNIANLMLKAYLEKGTAGGLGNMNINYIQSNPDYGLSWSLVNQSIKALRDNNSRTFTKT